MFHRLESTSQLQWTPTQEKTINRDYPFVDILTGETDEQFAIRNYLQFLWLPNSIMPLNMLIPTLLQIDSTLPTQLEPLLMSSRAVAIKFHVELPQILSDGGGAGEIEEAMMWFTLKHERDANDDRNISRRMDMKEEIWQNEAWKTGWLDRLEKREVQIQILLHLLKLSLEAPRIEAKDQDRLESLMDKMSMWQLIDRIESTRRPNDADERDWMQIFCEDIVERQFKSQLFDICSLLRSKLFPHSPFAENSDDSSRSSSPLLLHLNSGHTISAKVSHSSQPLKAPQGTTSRPTDTTSRRGDPGTLHFSRSRSRSLSITLAQDSDARRAGTVGGKKRFLNREVSMSRNFKAKTKKSTEGRKSADTKESSVKLLKSRQANDMGETLVVATPTKSRVSSESFHRDRTPTKMTKGGSTTRHFRESDQDEEEIWEVNPIRSNLGVTLVAATPMKRRC